MMKSRNLTKSLALYLLVFLLYPLNAFAVSPTAQLKSTVDKVIEILTDSRLRGEPNTRERRKALRETIVPHFDFKEMAKRSLGSNWRRRTLKEQKEFVQIFATLLEKTYLGQIDSYNNEKLIYTTETIDGSHAEVGTKILRSKGEFTINYRLHRVANAWKVYDLVVENISLVNNYRSQFSRIIHKSSYDELVSRMKQKLSETTG